MTGAKMKINVVRSHLKTLFFAALLSGVAGCDNWSDLPKNIREYPEPWQTLDPGKPLEKFPKIEILEQGGGAIIEPGDLVQLHLITDDPIEGVQRERGEWWIWVGFKNSKETAFFTKELGVASALAGLKQGTALRFLEPKGNWVSAGRLYINPFGDYEYYSWRKNNNDFTEIYIPYQSGYSVLTVKRVCKGPLQYRTVRLFDDSPVVIRRGFDSWISHEPSEMWIREARIDAQCQDGRKVYFQYGPDGVGNRGGSPVIGYFDQWLYDAWKKLDLGVQFVGNRPPVHLNTNDQLLREFFTQMDTPKKIDLSKLISDPDGDKLTVSWIAPENGTITPNPDGTFTYTPKPGWSGSETLVYKVSDGLVEANGKERVSIRVKEPKRELKFRWSKSE